MKKPLVLIALSSILLPFPSGYAQSALDRLKQKAQDKLQQKTEDATDKTADKVVDTADPSATEPPAEAAPANPAAASPAQAAAPATTVAYQNYDFVPGESIVFEDALTDAQDGEFPSRWELVAGQAVANKAHGYPALLLTDGNYARVSPRVRTKSYLGDAYTVELNQFWTPGQYPLIVMFLNADGTEAQVSIGNSEASFSEGVTNSNFSGRYPAAVAGEDGSGFEGKWHHIALAVKGHQLKVYVDQARVLVVPDMHFVPVSLQIAGAAEQDKPIGFTAMKIAAGGGMNMIGQKFTEAKIVTHGINFDVDKAVIRPESMGVLNQIKRVMADNPDLKFEIGGHTDASGSAAHNLALSQQRADAVKAQLVALGVKGSQLTAKGYGDTEAIGDNATPEGKANNAGWSSCGCRWASAQAACRVQGRAWRTSLASSSDRPMTELNWEPRWSRHHWQQRRSSSCWLSVSCAMAGRMLAGVRGSTAA